MVFFHDCSKCRFINYLDPYYFWNWEGRFACANCGAVYYAKLENGRVVSGPSEAEGPPDVLPLLADRPSDGYGYIRPGTSGKTRPYLCLMRNPSTYTGKARKVMYSIRGLPVRGWGPQPPSAGPLGSMGFDWSGRWELLGKKEEKGGE